MKEERERERMEMTGEGKKKRERESVGQLVSLKLALHKMKEKNVGKPAKKKMQF